MVLALIVSHSFTLQMFFSQIKRPAAAAAAKFLQLCPTLCDPIDGNSLGSSVPGILQARTLEWVAISFSNAWKWKVKVKSLSRAQLLATHGLEPTRLLHPWDFPGKSTGVSGVPLILQKRPNSHQKKEKTEYSVLMKAKSDRHCSILLAKYKLE